MASHLFKENILERIKNDIVNGYNSYIYYELACEFGHIDLVKFMVNIYGLKHLKGKHIHLNTPFAAACINGHVEIVEFLLNSDDFDDSNTCNTYGDIPYLLACEHSHIEVAKLLKKQIGFIDSRNNVGFTPFLAACSKGSLKSVEWLINNDINCLNDKDKYGRTGFYLACKHGYIDIVKFLISCGSTDLNNRLDSNNRSDLFFSPLSAACAKDHIEMVKLLLMQPNIIICENIIYFCDNSAINGLMKSYIANPEKIRKKLILEQNIIIFSHIICLCDNYLTIKK